MAESYDTYFASGLYKSRYPRPNRRTMRLLRAALPKGGRLIDYGAGEGRYCLALAREGIDVVATDISPVARAHLSQSVEAAGLSGRITVADVEGREVDRLIDGRGRFDVALLGFGVLGHVAGRAHRIALLARLRANLKAGGRLVLGLPNARRRFREAQARSAGLPGLEPGDIRYRREAGDGAIPLYYHLYRREEIGEELGAAGFEIERLTSESIFPEYAVTHHRWLGVIDDALASLVPADLGYGYLVVAKVRR